MVTFTVTVYTIGSGVSIINEVIESFVGCAHGQEHASGEVGPALHCTATFWDASLLLLRRLYIQFFAGVAGMLLSPYDPTSSTSILFPPTGLLTADAGLVGQVGGAVSVLRPSGKARFGENLVDVVSDGPFISPGTAVEVVRVEGNRVFVRESNETA